MIGSFLTRGLVMIFGYAYPAYECHKTLDKNKADIEQLHFWCQYWILVAMMTMLERVGDTFVSWVPMYSEAKLFSFIYLWHPKTKGTTYIYNSFFGPYIAKHEIDIDHSLLELRTKAGVYAVLYWQKAANYGQTRVLNILRYIASQSTPKPRSTQQQGTRVTQPAAAQNQKASATAPPQTENPPSCASSTASSEDQDVLAEEEVPSVVPSAAPTTAVLNAAKTALMQPLAGSPKLTASSREAMAGETAPPLAKEDINNPPLQDTVMEGSIRVTHGRLRRMRAASNR